MTDASDALPIEGAQLSVYAADTLNTSTFTDSDGNYTVLGLLPGTYSVSAEHNSYLSVSEMDIDILIGEKTSVDFELTLE